KEARKTGDFSLNQKAEAAVGRALEISPSDVPARKLQAALHLAYHRFPEAADAANKLRAELPSDSFAYGVLTDAYMELGEYEKSVDAAQRMVDLKPGTASYSRVAQLRVLHGDHKGALEMFTQAARVTDPSDKETQSWCLVQLGDEHWRHGEYPEAEKVYDEALQNFPGYFLAVAAKGRARASAGDFETAINLLNEAQNRVPNADTIALLGDIYFLRGDSEKAQAQYDLLEVVEQKLGAAGDQKRLALSWADRGVKLDQALAIATGEYAARKDIYTTDVLAWCLYRNGKIAEAKEKIDEAMRLKTNSARILFHAGMIANASGNSREAKRQLTTALKLNPTFDLIQARAAKEKLAELR
ncbi:MAG TPA: tetratricopeptide repeat protein, partial [Pyrinomonadaceae bacterium]|nr:tetratricopeptide repeat protein [Pyrinomonadaceae bacterium]